MHVRLPALLAALLGGCVAQIHEPPSGDEPRVLSAAAPDPACRDGIRNGDACCAASCGSCGGEGCSGRPGGAAACCVGRIRDSDRSCSSASAPCVIDDEAPTCSGIANGDACCAASCGTCGGEGCSGRPGGAAACCVGRIRDSGRSCADAPPPCLLAGGGPSPGTGGGDPPLAWRRANLTTFTSYPDPGSEECIRYNGCQWAGQFAALDEQMSESWVRAHDIAAVHSRDFSRYRLKTLRVRQGSRQLDVKVYDMCADSDCSGCCTENASQTGFLLDLEKYTAQRFGADDGVVEWACLDC